MESVAYIKIRHSIRLEVLPSRENLASDERREPMQSPTPETPPNADLERR